MKKTLILLITSTILFSCKDENTVKDFDNCCKKSYLNDSVGNSFVKVANIFTPNNDGRNDKFIIFHNNLKSVKSFKVFDYKNTLIYSKDSLNSPDFTWNFYVNFNTRYLGHFYYEFQATSNNNQTKIIKGEACSTICENKYFVPLMPIFPSQFDGVTFNISLPSGELNGCQ